MGGLRGAIMFLQKEQNQPLDIKVQMDPFSGELGLGIYSYPMVYNGNAHDSCSSAQVGALISNGNLTEKHGPFTYKMAVTNTQLKAYGRDSILGRTVVVRNRVTSIVIGCAPILPFDKEVIYATARLNGLVSGEVRFLQDKNDSKSGVLVVGELYYTDGRAKGSDNHGWFISSSSSSDFNDCSKLTAVYSSGSKGNGTCSIYEPLACEMGDLSSKLANISVGIANSNSLKKPFRLIDGNLAVENVFGHALVIRDVSGSPVACTNILKGGSVSLAASFSSGKHDGVSGSVSFKQDSPYHPTVIKFAIDGLAKKANGIHVHEYPIPSPAPVSSPCANAVVGGHLNPYKVVKDSSYPVDGANVTMDKYEVGDISGKFGNLVGLSSVHKEAVDVQMDLFGRYGILNRGLVIHRNDASGSRWVCANILPDASSKQLSATANFTTTSGLQGTVNLIQFMLPDGIMTDTGITMKLDYKSSSSQNTKNHNWHVHIEPVGSDWKSAINERCKSVGPHYNPYKVNATGTYSKECSPDTLFRCELGDLSAKQAKYDIGGGKQYYLDVNTPLFSATSVIGRSITVHTENAGAPRLACADIIPDSIAAVAQIDLTFPEDVPFNKTDIQTFIANTLRIASWQIRYIKGTLSSKICRSVSFYVLDNRGSPNATYYKHQLQQRAKNKQLGKYNPCE
eukprot:gene11985-2568_t